MFLREVLAAVVANVVAYYVCKCLDWLVAVIFG